MHSKLLQSIVARHGYPVVREGDWTAFAAAHEHTLLMIAGDASRLAESDDLAVILPELMKVFGRVLTPAIAASEAERFFQRTFRFPAFPALVIVRGTDYLGAVSRVRDWSEYLAEIPEILGRQPSVPPPFKLPTPPPASSEDTDRADPLHLHH